MSLPYVYVGNHFKGRELPGDPVVWALCFHFQGLGSIPGQGTKIPQAVWCGQEKKKEKKRSLSATTCQAL